MKYAFIESEAQLKAICSTLEHEKTIGVDLEADSMHSFKEKICLIQISNGKEAFLVDPFVVRNVDPFLKILEDNNIVKIFHGADFDIRSIDRDYGTRVNNLFDTEIACRFLGVQERGLGALLKAHFNVDADKKFQKVDWSKRPLDIGMIEYSVTDVAHLAGLYSILTEQLESVGRFSWAKEEFEYQEQVRYEANNKPPLFKKIKGAGRLDNRSLAVLENLLEFRIKEAEKKDRPLFKVISNKALLLMANEKPNSVDAMVRLKALSPRQAKMYGNGCLKAVRKAVNMEHKDLPSYPRTRKPKKDKRVLARIQQLKKMRETLSISLNMEPGILLNNNMITSISVQNPQTIETLSTIEGLRNWQVEALGSEILKTI